MAKVDLAFHVLFCLCTHWAPKLGSDEGIMGAVPGDVSPLLTWRSSLTFTGSRCKFSELSEKNGSGMGPVFILNFDNLFMSSLH